VELFRPVGLAELRLIYEADMRYFPPRLPEQPIFYPVLNAQYAAQISHDWNARSEEQAGYVTRFAIDDTYAARFETRKVGAREHLELWVPADELADFNRHLMGPIALISASFGDRFRGEVPASFMLQGKTAPEQLDALGQILEYNGVDFLLELRANHTAIFLNYPYWAVGPLHPGMESGWRNRVLQAIRRGWPPERPALMETSAIAA
jgi:hypothetical protein